VASLRAAVEGTHFSRYEGHPLYRTAVGPMLSLMLVGPQLGLGRAALDYVIEKAGARPVAYTAYARQSDSVGFQIQIARAAAKVETAHLHAYRAAEDIDAAARRGVHLDVPTRARVRADCAVTLESINEALNQLLFAHGASSFSSTSPLQRIWRDSNIAARHAVTLPELNYEIYGKVLLGLEHRVVELTPAL
jgi:alkylation response protein AidB-like acyl-CoA dehydrogenase